VEPTQPVSGGAGDGVAPASGLAPTGYVAPTCQPLPGSEPTVQLAAHCPAAGSAPACLTAGAAASDRHGSGHAAPKLVLPACLPTTTSPATSDGFEVLAAGCMSSNIHADQLRCLKLCCSVTHHHTSSHPGCVYVLLLIPPASTAGRKRRGRRAEPRVNGRGGCCFRM
jgi:hypothetical protein